jgi:predicted glutamine amidotransferase
VAYVNGDRIDVERSTTNASSDPSFTQVATDIATPVGIAHLRWASPGLAVELRNAHPFSWGRAAFAHNGGIYPLERIGELLSDEWRGRLTGTTDSEHYFLAVAAEVARTGGDIATAIPRVVGRITESFTPSSLNAMLLTPETLYVINCHDASVRPPLPPRDSQSVDELVERTEEEVPYYDLRYRCTEDSVVVASSGFAQPEGAGWRRTENNSLLVIDRATLSTTEIPMDVSIRTSAAAQTAGADLR